MICENAVFNWKNDTWFCLECGFQGDDKELERHQGFVAGLFCAECLGDGYRTMIKADGICQRCGCVPERVFSESPGGGGLYGTT